MNQVQEFGIPQTVSYLYSLSHLLCLAECFSWQKLPRKSCSTEGIIQAKIPQDSQVAQDPVQVLQKERRHHYRFHIHTLGKTSGTQKCLSLFCANFSLHMISGKHQRYSAISQLQSKNRSINECCHIPVLEKNYYLTASLAAFLILKSLFMLLVTESSTV